MCKTILLMLAFVTLTCHGVQPYMQGDVHNGGLPSYTDRHIKHRSILQLYALSANSSQYNISPLVNSSLLAGQQLGNSTQLLPLATGSQAVALETTLTVITYGGSIQQGDPRLLNLALNVSQLTTPPLTSDLNFTGQSLAFSIVIQTNGWVSDCTPASQQLFLSAMVNITSLPTTSIQLKSCTTFSAVSAGRRHLVRTCCDGCETVGMYADRTPLP